MFFSSGKVSIPQNPELMQDTKAIMESEAMMMRGTDQGVQTDLLDTGEKDMTVTKAYTSLPETQRKAGEEGQKERTKPENEHETIPQGSYDLTKTMGK